LNIIRIGTSLPGYGQNIYTTKRHVIKLTTRLSPTTLSASPLHPIAPFGLVIIVLVALALVAVWLV
jgi:hypothetical protein